MAVFFICVYAHCKANYFLSHSLLCDWEIFLLKHVSPRVVSGGTMVSLRASSFPHQSEESGHFDQRSNETAEKSESFLAACVSGLQGDIC